MILSLCLRGMGICGLASLAVSQAPFGLLERLPGVSPLGGWRSPAVLQLADLDGDLFPDLVAPGAAAHSFNDRRGGFGPWIQPFPNYPKTNEFPGQDAIGYGDQIAIGDVDGDGDVDLLAATWWQPWHPVPFEALYLNDGRGVFTLVSRTHIPGPRSAGSAVFSDVDRDGDLDVVLGCRDLVSPQNLRLNVIYLNDGQGRFRYDPARASLPLDTDETIQLAAGDLDGDGDEDVICGNDGRYGFPTRVYLNDGTGKFSSGTALPPAIGYKLELGDLDGDADLDLGVFSDGNSAPMLFENDGNANFKDITGRLIFSGLPWIYGGGAFGDIDADGDLDIMLPSYAVQVGTNEYRFVHQYVNDGTGHFVDMTHQMMPSSPSWYRSSRLVLSDLDGDGDLDVFANDWWVPPSPTRNRPVLWNLTRQIYPPAAAKVGQGWELQIHGAPGSTVFPAVSPAPGFTPLGALGVLGLDPTRIFAMPSVAVPPSRVGKLTLTVPNDPRLVGRKLYWQALFVDPSGLSLHLSNVFEEEVTQ